MANTRKTRNGVAGAAKKGNELGQLFTGALISAAVNNIVTPGSFDKILSWLSDNISPRSSSILSSRFICQKAKILWKQSAVNVMRLRS